MRMRKLMWIAWPSFLLASVLEVLVFAVVDPHDLHGWNGVALDFSRPALYTLAFFAFWLVIGVACALTLMLSQTPVDEDGQRELLRN